MANSAKREERIRVLSSIGTHIGGTKYYSLTLISAGGPNILLKVWGKVGSKGQGKVEKIWDKKAIGEFVEAFDERLSKGYHMESYSTYLEKTLDDLPGPIKETILHHVPDHVLREIIPSYGASFVAGRDKALEDAIKAKAEIEADAEAAELRSNPLFGMF